MAIYNTGYVSILLTKEGAARANELNENGITVKVTHMRVYRTPTLVQNIPYKFDGTENRALVNSWQCFPNHETSFEVIEDSGPANRVGYLQLLGTLGADVGTFSYDAVGLFLEDDTLYAIGVTNRLLTKRKASIGSSPNIQELSFGIAHETVVEVGNFDIVETVINYTKISEVEFVHQLPNKAIPNEVIYRVTNSAHQTYTGTGAFKTWLASQRKKTIGSLSDTVWVMHDHIQLFERLDLKFYVVSGNLRLSVPISSRYPVDLIPTDREVIISFFNPNKSIAVPSAMKLRLQSRSTDASSYNFVFAPVGTTLSSVQENTLIRGTLYMHSSDCIYQDAIQSAIKTMTEIEYSAGRTFQTDNVDVNPATLLKPYWNRDSNWRKLDSNVEVATSTFDGRLFNPSQLQPIVFKAGSIKHMVLRATALWLNTDTGAFTPTLTLDKGVAVFGQTIRATISAPDAKPGSQIAWYLREDRDNIIQSPVSNVGYVTLDSTGKGYIDITINWSMVDAQYRIYVGLVGYGIERQCLLTPMQGEVYFSADAQGTSRVDSANEGVTVFLITRTTYPYNGLELFFKQETGTTTNPEDFESDIPFSTTLTNGFSAIPVRIRNDDNTEGDEVLIIGLYTNAGRTSKLGNNATLTITDTSVNPIPSYEIFISADQNSDVPLTADSKLGDTVWLIVKGYNVPIIHDVTITFSGDFDLVIDAEPDLLNPLTITLTNGRGAYRINSVAPDVTPPTGPTVRSLTISETRTTTFNIYNEYVALFGAPPNDLELTVNVLAGVYVVGTDTNSPAIDGRGAWSGGVVLKLSNKGKIYGRGGNGGNLAPTFGNTTPRLPTNGGVAIIAQDTNPIYINNYVSQGAEIKGGGGGGASMTYTFTNMYAYGGFGEYKFFDYVEFPVSGGGGQPLGKAGGTIYSTGGGYCAGNEFCSETYYALAVNDDATLQAPSGALQKFYSGWVSTGQDNEPKLVWSLTPMDGITNESGFFSPYGGIAGSKGNLTYSLAYANISTKQNDGIAGASTQGLVYLSNI